MKPEIKERWLTALRSGEYRQGTGQLRSEKDGDLFHCCLGVLCDLFVKEKNDPNIGWKIDEVFDNITFTNGHDSEPATLPSSVKEWAEINEDNPLIDVNGMQDSIAAYNDDGGTFEEIAAIIEKQL